MTLSIIITFYSININSNTSIIVDEVMQDCISQLKTKHLVCTVYRIDNLIFLFILLPCCYRLNRHVCADAFEVHILWYLMNPLSTTIRKKNQWNFFWTFLLAETPIDCVWSPAEVAQTTTTYMAVKLLSLCQPLKNN